MSKSRKPREIRISGARTNNLKNVGCAIPHEALTVVTGLSGSGKSSLAFDTLYAEGQRRYVESMSAYARQFLERIEKPDVDNIQNILPAIALEQKNRVKNARSTVGTATEIYDYLRVLFATIGQRASSGDDAVFTGEVPDIEAQLAGLAEGTRLIVLAPLPHTARSGKKWAADLQEKGWFRVWLDDEIREIADVQKDLNKAETVLVVVDRLIVRKKDDYRLREAVRNALDLGEGLMAAMNLSENETRYFREAQRETFSPNLFSFNHPLGACPTCEGFGRIIGLDMDKVIPNKKKTLKEGAVHPFTTPSNAEIQDLLFGAAKRHKVPLDVPYEDLTDDQKAFVMNGKGGYPGIRKFFEWLEGKRYKVHVRVLLAKYRGYYTCPDCLGSRLRADALNIRIGQSNGGKNIKDLCEVPIPDVLQFFDELEPQLSGYERQASERLIRDIRTRLKYLVDVGLHYLTLGRQSRTLSGGEAQRINLSAALGLSLTDTLYVLDEPTVGLHARDTNRLLSVLKALRDNGNTLVVVEHDPEIIMGADHIIDMGPAGGEEGGRIVFEGSLNELMETKYSVTAQYLRNPPKPSKRQSQRLKLSAANSIEIAGACGNNLKDVTVRLPRNQLVCVTGVSGSGKSTLIKQTLFAGYEHDHGRSLELDALPYSELNGLDEFKDVIMVDQSPPGRSQRSNPVTYMKAYDEIRKLFADSRKAMVMGLKPGDFSFNTPGGRCEKCEGLGVITIDMQFMADVTVVCPDCKGRRFKHRILTVDLFGRNINDVLNMTVDEAMAFFKTVPAIRSRLKPLQDIGLAYLRLGQSTTTLSGGEAQRLKLASYLKSEGKKDGPYLFLFDEPTTGLHMSDIDTLVEVFRRLVDDGHSLIVIEHNIDFIAQADHIVDLGPDGGDGGGRVIFQGTVEELVKEEDNWTAQYLRKKLEGEKAVKPAKVSKPRKKTASKV